MIGMNLWQRIKNAVAGILNIQVTTSPSMDEESFLEWLGIDRKKRKEPYQEATYFICLKMMSETIGKMPWKFYQRTPKGIKEPEDTEMSRLMKTRPNPLMTPTVFWSTVEMNRNHYGNAYVYIRRKFKRKRYGGELQVLDMWVMPSNCVQIMVDDKGYFGGVGKIWYVYSDRYSGQQYVFGTDDVLHLKTSHSFDGITGLPVQAILVDTVDGAQASQEFLNNLYKNGLTAKAVLEYTGDLNKEAKDKLVQAFEEYGAGTKNTGRILPVPLGMKLTPLNINLADNQFIDLKKYSALQIAAAFGIKPNQINDYEKSSYSNSEMQQLSFYIDTMLFVMKQYEEEVNFKTLEEEEQEEGKYFKLNEKVLLRTDSKTQMEIFSNSVNNGIQTPNECRRKLDLQDKEGGDQLIVNGSYIPLYAVGQQYGVTQDGEEQPEGTEEQLEELPEGAEGAEGQQERQPDGGQMPPAGEEEDGQEGQQPPDDDSIQPETETEEPTPSEGEAEEEDGGEKPEEETAETEAEGEDQEGGGDDEEEDELHKKKS